jgi:hypothetical protein
MYEVDVRYTEAMVREAVRAFYWRTLQQWFGWSGALAFLLTLAALGFVFAAGDRSWFVGLVGACLLFVLTIIALGYGAHYRSTTGRFRRMRNPQARFVFSESDLSMISELGSATVPWSSVREAWMFPTFWLILLSRSSFVTLPIETVGEDVRALIRRKVAAR